MKALPLVAVLASLVVASSTLGQTITFAGKNGNMKLENISSWSTRLTGKNTMHFKAIGHKLNGFWADRNLSVTANTIEGDAIRTAAGSLTLQKATLDGGVHTQVLRDGQTITTDSATAIISFVGEDLRIDMDGGVVINSESPKNGESTHATSKNGYVRVTPKTGLGRGSLFGSVKVAMVRKTIDATTHLSKLTNMVATCKRMDIDRMSDPATITLIGDVALQGNDPVMAGDIRAAKAVITLDAQGQPVGIDAEGDPGVMRVRERTH